MSSSSSVVKCGLEFENVEFEKNWKHINEKIYRGLLA